MFRLLARLLLAALTVAAVFAGWVAARHLLLADQPGLADQGREGGS